MEMSLEKYMAARSAFYTQAIRDWLPYREVNVDERVRVNLGSIDISEVDPPMDLAAFVAKLQEVAGDASGVQIELSGSYSEDCRDVECELFHYRDPTPEERAEREETNRKIRERDRLKAIEAEEREKAEFERLAAKYGRDSDTRPKDGDA